MRPLHAAALCLVAFAAVAFGLALGALSASDDVGSAFWAGGAMLALTASGKLSATKGAV